MSRAEEPTKNDSEVRALVKRQVQAWEGRDFALAAGDWLPNGELFSPLGNVLKKDMQSAIVDYFKKFNDLKVTVNEMFLSQDGTRLAIQWDWTVTRKRDRERTTTHDAIFVRLVGGKPQVERILRVIGLSAVAITKVKPGLNRATVFAATR